MRGGELIKEENLRKLRSNIGREAKQKPLISGRLLEQ